MGRKEQVRRYHEVLRDAHDLEAMPSILRRNFTFEGERVIDVRVLGDLKSLEGQLK